MKKQEKNVSSSSKKSILLSTETDNESLDEMEMVDFLDEKVDYLISELEHKKEEAYIYKNKTCKLEKYSKSGDEYIEKLLHEIEHIKKQLAYYQNEKNKTKILDKKGMITFKENLEKKMKSATNEISDERKKALVAADDKILDEMEKRRLEKIYATSKMLSFQGDNFKYLGEQVRKMNKNELKHFAEVVETDNFGKNRKIAI